MPELVERWWIDGGRERENDQMESAAWAVASFEHSRLRGVNSAVEVDIRRRTLQMLSITAKLLISTTMTSLTTSPSLFTTPALVCYLLL